MVITNFIEYLFYEETPACILFSFEIKDEITCEEITKSFDALFYISFIMALTMMLLRLSKLTVMILKVVEYLFIVKFFEDSVADNSRNKRFLLLMSKLQLWNENHFGVCKRRQCEHKLVNCLLCNHNSRINVIKNNNSIFSNLFTVLFNGCKSQLRDSSLEKDMEDIKLIFMNDNYCNKDNKSKSNFQLKEYKSTRSLNFSINSSTTTIAKRGQEDKHDPIMVVNGAEKAHVKYLDKQESTESTLHSTSLSDPNIMTPKANNCTDINEKEKQKNYLRCKNKYVHRIFRLMPVPVYPLLLLEKNHMRIVVKKYNNVNNYSGMKVDEEQCCKRTSKLPNYKRTDSIELKEKQASTNNLSTTSSLLYADTVTSSSIKSNDTYLLDKPSNVIKKISNPVKVRDPARNDDIKTANMALRLKENKRRNLLRYIESLNSNRKTNVAHVRPDKFMNAFDSDQNKIKSNMNYNSPQAVFKKKCPQTRFDGSCTARITDFKLETHNLDQMEKLLIKKYNGVALNRSQSLQLSTNKNKDKVTDVRAEIVNTLVNLPRDTLTTMRNRYKLHKINKNRKPTSNNNLDVIHENSSRSNVDMNEK